MTDDHTPDPGFVDHLEWELKSTMRRQGPLEGTSSAMRPFSLRLGAALALVAVSVFVGGAGTYAVTHRIDQRTAALSIARCEALLEIARTRLEPFARELAKTQALARREVASERQLRKAEARYAQAESEADIREIELAETRRTGKASNDALSAPLVDGRDFVTERMDARRRPMQRWLELAIDQVRRNQELIDANVASPRELESAQTEVVAAEGELIGLEKRTALRASFLAGELSAADVQLRGMRLAAIADRQAARRQVEVLVEQHKRLMLLVERGIVSHSERQAVETDLRTAKARVELADLEVRILDQKLEDASVK